MAQKAHSLSHTKWQGVKIIEGRLMPDARPCTYVSKYST